MCCHPPGVAQLQVKAPYWFSLTAKWPTVCCACGTTVVMKPPAISWLFSFWIQPFLPWSLVPSLLCNWRKILRPGSQLISGLQQIHPQRNSLQLWSPEVPRHGYSFYGTLPDEKHPHSQAWPSQAQGNLHNKSWAKAMPQLVHWDWGAWNQHQFNLSRTPTPHPKKKFWIGSPLSSIGKEQERCTTFSTSMFPAQGTEKGCGVFM